MTKSSGEPKNCENTKINDSEGESDLLNKGTTESATVGNKDEGKDGNSSDESKVENNYEKDNQDGTFTALKDSKGRKLAKCGYFKRELPKPIPSHIPIDLSPENADKLQLWLLDNFAASTFNTCPYQKLLLINSSPKLKFH